MNRASRGARTGSALPNPILEDAFVYEIRVTKSSQILSPGSGCTRIARGCDSRPAPALYCRATQYRERAVAALWCGGSEVRIISAASPKCGLLNQSHTRSISCWCPSIPKFANGCAAQRCELRNRDTGGTLTLAGKALGSAPVHAIEDCHGQGHNHQGEAGFERRHRILLRDAQELAHHDRQAGEEEVRPRRQEARRVQGNQDQVADALALRIKAPRMEDAFCISPHALWNSDQSR